MGDYSYQEHLDLFGGPPEPGESFPDLEQVDLMRKAQKEDPPWPPRQSIVQDETFVTTDEDLAALAEMRGEGGSAMVLEGSTADDGPEPTCEFCGQETHKLEALAACRAAAARKDRQSGDVEADEPRDERWEP